ncbi:hypothetical protein AB6813_20755 [bacterium RCC_150]
MIEILDGLDVPLVAASDEEVRVFILTGAGRAFSGGVDQKFVDSAMNEAIVF